MGTMKSDKNCKKSALITALGITVLAFLMMVNITCAAPVAPVTSFTENQTSGTAPLSVRFNDTSSNAPETWLWQFGDGSNSTEQNPVHTFFAAGIYTVFLNSTNAAGSNISEPVTINVTAPVDLIDPIEPIDPVDPVESDAPVADFYTNVRNGYAPLSIQFADKSQNATRWGWDFGDKQTSINQNPSHTYNDPGIYTVSLTVFNQYGSDTKSAKIEAFEEYPPVADFITSVKSGYAPLAVQFADESEGATRWSWDFGDGYTSTDKNPAHCYNEPGKYTIKLKVFNQRGYANSKTDIIEVFEEYPPVVDFSSNVKSGYAPLAVQFADESEGATGWGWDFGDGYTSTDQNPAHCYNEPGTYTVELTVTNDQGYTSSKTAKIEAFEEYSPVADFSNNVKSGYAPLAVQFTDKSEHATRWGWDFGDGYTSVDQSPWHIYNEPGIYTVELTVANDQGYTSSKTATIEVLSKLPVADFNISAKRGYAPLSVQFADNSEDATGWGWEFGDGHTATGQNPAYTFSKAGKYTISLTVTNQYGSDWKSATIEVL